MESQVGSNWIQALVRENPSIDGSFFDRLFVPLERLVAPVNEFQTPLGWDEAKPGGTFIKIGVGVLRKVEGNYNRYFPYEVVDPGKWSVRKQGDSIEFTQELSDPNSGYG